MERQQGWSIEEAVLLLDTYLTIQQRPDRKNELILSLSEALRMFAVESGKSIDDKFRNVAGIKFQLLSMASAMEGHTIVKPASKCFSHVVDLYKNGRAEYEKILAEVKGKLGCTAECEKGTCQSKISEEHMDVVKVFQDELWVGTEKDKQLLDKYPVAYKRVFCVLMDAAPEHITIESIFDKVGRVIRCADIEELLIGVSWAEIEGNGFSFSNEIVEKNTMDTNEGGRDELENTNLRDIFVANFKNGYRVTSALEYKRFARAYESVTGSSCPYTNEQINEIANRCGILIEDRVFFPENLLDQDARQKLLNYVDCTFSEGKTKIYYSAIMHELRDVFSEQSIYDAQMLKEYLRHIKQRKWYFFKDFFSTEADEEENPSLEIEAFLLSKASPASYDEMSRELSNIPIETIKKILGKENKYIWNCKETYFHIGIFQITEDELEKIADLIEYEIKTNGFLVTVELLDILNNRVPCVIENNPDISIWGIRNVLALRLGDRYNFNNNVICAKGHNIEMSDVFAQYAQTRKRFTTEELCAYGESVGAQVIYGPVYQNAIRIDQNHFVPFDEVSFDVENADKAISVFCKGEFIPLSGIRNFSVFPEAGVRWTIYLLESFLTNFSRSYKLVHSSYNTFCAVGGIVEKNSKINSFEELITNALAKSDCILEKENALKFLKEEGYLSAMRYAKIEQILIQARAIRNSRKG